MSAQIRQAKNTIRQSRQFSYAVFFRYPSYYVQLYGTKA